MLLRCGPPLEAEVSLPERESDGVLGSIETRLVSRWRRGGVLELLRFLGLSESLPEERSLYLLLGFGECCGLRSESLAEADVENVNVVKRELSSTPSDDEVGDDSTGLADRDGGDDGGEDGGEGGGGGVSGGGGGWV